MFAAAIVGIAAAFAMQSGFLEGGEPQKVLGASDASGEALKNQMGTMEQRLMARADDVATSVEMLASELQALRDEVKNLKLKAPVMASPAAVGGEEGSAPVNLSAAINQALDDREKRREEERDAERAKNMESMRERMKEWMTSRTQRIAEEKGWDAAKTETVNQIMSEYYDKMGQMGMSMFGGRGRRGGRGGFGGSEESRAQMQQLTEDTKTKLLTVVTEEEANQLLRSRGPMGSGRSDRGGARPGGGGRGR
jgi:hypothetical protein